MGLVFDNSDVYDVMEFHSAKNVIGLYPVVLMAASNEFKLWNMLYFMAMYTSAHKMQLQQPCQRKDRRFGLKERHMYSRVSSVLRRNHITTI